MSGALSFNVLFPFCKCCLICLVLPTFSSWYLFQTSSFWTFLIKCIFYTLYCVYLRNSKSGSWKDKNKIMLYTKCWHCQEKKLPNVLSKSTQYHVEHNNTMPCTQINLISLLRTRSSFKFWLLQSGILIWGNTFLLQLLLISCLACNLPASVLPFLPYILPLYTHIKTNRFKMQPFPDEFKVLIPAFSWHVNSFFFKLLHLKALILGI